MKGVLDCCDIEVVGASALELELTGNEETRLLVEVSVVEVAVMLCVLLPFSAGFDARVVVEDGESNVAPEMVRLGEVP